MRKSLLVAMAVLVGGVLAVAQIGPLGAGGKIAIPSSLDKLAEMLEQEVSWLSGLNISAPGWDKALASLKTAVEELKGETEPSIDTLTKVSVSLHLVLDILERGKVKEIGARLKGEAAPEWLQKYLAQATEGMGPEEAAKVKEIVEGFLKGLRRTAMSEGPGRQLAARFGHGPAGKPAGREGMLGQRRPSAGPAGEVPPEFKLWAKGYLEGVTSVLGEDQAQKVRSLCLGALKARQEFGEEQRQNARHFLKLRLISAQLDMFIVNHSAGYASRRKSGPKRGGPTALPVLLAGYGWPVRIWPKNTSSGTAPSKLVVSLITILGTAITW